MSTKKKAFLILGIVVLALLLITVTLTLIFHKGYLQKTDYDHVSEVAYNDWRIVGRNGLFYLSRDGKIVGDGYVSLQSVNDAYTDMSPDWQSADDLIFYDFYIARRAGESEYYLLSAEGDEYRISGDNYSLSEIRLPYLIFVNNTTGRHAVLSLDKLDSDLSYRSGSELTLKPFTSVSAVRNDPDRLLYTHLETYDASAEHPYSIFSKNGTCLFSSKNFEKNAYTWGDAYRAVYYRDLAANTVYAADGTLLGHGVVALHEVGGAWGWLRCTDETGQENRLLILSPRKGILLSEKDYDLSAPTILDGSLLVPLADGEGMALVAATDGKVTTCSHAEVTPEGIVVATPAEGDTRLLLSENATLLMKTAYTDMVALPALSDADCYVFESARYNEEHGGRYLHFTREGSEAVTVGLSAGVAIDKLSAQGNVPVSGSFLLTETAENGAVLYRLLVPFTTRMFSDTYDRLDVYSQAGIFWARGTSYSRLTHSFLDPVSGQTAATVTCTEEEMALALFEFVTVDSLLPDPYDAESAVPILMLRLSYEGQDLTVANTVRYFALYRSAAASARAFQAGTLRVTEIGKGLLRTNPFELFPKDNVLICHDADSSRVYRLSEANVLVEVAAVPYHVTAIMHDRSDPALLYFLVESETGKMGLYDENGSPVLAPYYDDIFAADGGHFVVSLRGAWGVVEYTAGTLRQVLDYLYVQIVPLPDHAYLAKNGNGEAFLFEGKSLLNDRAVQSYRLLRSYRINENGELCYRLSLLISIEGQLSLHDCEIDFRPTVTDFVHPTVTDTSIENERALVIYYDHNGKRVDMDVIMPTDAARAAFVLPSSPTGNGWFWQAQAGEGAVPVSEADILALNTHTVILYTK